MAPKHHRFLVWKIAQPFLISYLSQCAQGFHEDDPEEEGETGETGGNDHCVARQFVIAFHLLRHDEGAYRSRCGENADQSRHRNAVEAQKVSTEKEHPGDDEKPPCHRRRQGQTISTKRIEFKGRAQKNECHRRSAVCDLL